MAYILEVFIIDGGDQTIKVGHQFYGLTQAEVETYKREHLANCEYFRAAEKEGRTIESIEEVDEEELPDVSDYEDDEDYEYEEMEGTE